MKYTHVNTPADGSCLFHAVAIGIHAKLTGTILRNKSTKEKYGLFLREKVMDYILKRKTKFQNMLNMAGDTYPKRNRYSDIHDHVKHMRKPHVYGAILEVSALSEYIRKEYGLNLQIFIVNESKRVYDSQTDFVTTLSNHSNRRNNLTIVLHNQHYTYVHPKQQHNNKINISVLCM